MSTSFKADQFTQAPAIEEFNAFQNDIQTTALALELHGPDSTGFHPLLMGSGAAARQDLNMRILKRGYSSDLDVVVSMDRFGELREKGLLRYAGTISEHVHMGWTRRSSAIPLPVEFFASDDPQGYLGFIGTVPYKGESNSSTLEIDGLQVVRATILAADKVRRERPRMKDIAGIIKAHIVAVTTEHLIVHDEDWQELVAKAIDMIMSNSIDPSYDDIFWRRTLNMPKYPSWLRQLKRSRFEHPAFENIRRTRPQIS